MELDNDPNLGSLNDRGISICRRRFLVNLGYSECSAFFETLRIDNYFIVISLSGIIIAQKLLKEIYYEKVVAGNAYNRPAASRVWH